MPRTVEVTIPPATREALLPAIKELEGLMGLRVQEGVSLQPPGDVIQVQVNTDGLHAFMQLLEKHDLTQEASVSVTTSAPMSIISQSHRDMISADDSEAIWEEMEMSIAQESNMTMNGLLLMLCAGVIATAGLATDALHIVAGAMVIAPGFEPISRIALGVIGRSRIWQRGLTHTLQAYGVLAVGAFITSLVLRALGYSLLGSGSAYLPPGELVSYWADITLSSLLVSTAASFAGGILIAANRSVLTAGVMLSLALVPSLTVSIMTALEGAWAHAGIAFVRWLLELLLVLLGSLLVFAWKSRRQKRGLSL